MTHSQRKRAPMLAALFLFTAVATGSAHADNKLFPTDVLDNKQIDVDADLGITEIKSSNHATNGVFSANAHSKMLSRGGSVGARFGLENATHVEVDVAYANSSVHSKSDLPSDDRLHASGIQGMQLALVHGFLPKGGSLTLAGRVSAQNQTERGLGHQAYNIYRAGLAVGKDWGGGLKGFSTIGLSLPEHGDLPKTHGVEFGMWIPVDQSVTLVPKFGYSHALATKDAPSSEMFNLALKAHVQLDQNSYVSPELSFTRSPGQDFTSHGLRISEKATKGRTLSVGFYHLY